MVTPPFGSLDGRGEHALRGLLAVVQRTRASCPPCRLGSPGNLVRVPVPGLHAVGMQRMRTQCLRQPHLASQEGTDSFQENFPILILHLIISVRFFLLQKVTY